MIAVKNSTQASDAHAIAWTCIPTYPGCLMPTAPVLGLGLITAAACVEGSCGLEADLIVGTIERPVSRYNSPAP